MPACTLAAVRSGSAAEAGASPSAPEVPAPASPRHAIAAALAAILVGAFALRIGGATWLPNVVWPDEIFQTLEQAHRLVFGYGILPWEFRVGARSWLLPGALGGVMAASSWMGGLAYLRAAQVVLSALSVVPVAVAFFWSRDRGRAAALAAAAICAFWFELVLFGPKALGEVVAAYGAGRVVEPGNIEELAAGLGVLLRDPDALAEARAGAERAREALTWDAAGAAHLEMYRELV